MRRFRLTLWALVALRRVRSENRTLRAELQKSRVREIALLDRVLTAANQYGLPDTLPTAKKRRPQPQPSGIEPENELERAELEFYEQSALEVGLPASDGISKWRKMAGERRQMIARGDLDLDVE